MELKNHATLTLGAVIVVFFCYCDVSQCCSGGKRTPGSRINSGDAVCVGDKLTWDAGFGKCDTYPLGLPNHIFCKEDCNGDDECAFQVCKECGECNPADDAMCTVDKVMVVSGPDSNRGVRTSLEETASHEACDDGSLKNKTCFELNKTFFKNFRTMGGHCNCLFDPMNGVNGDQLSRLLPGDHTRFDKPTFFTKPDDNPCDTKSCASSCEEESERLPKPRQVSIVIAEKDDTDKEDNNLSSLAILFGQFLDHDISLTPETHLDDSCCEQKNDECMQIELAPDDPFYSPLGQQCLSLTRSLPHCSSGFPPPKIREQQTLITAFLDSSNVYGSDVERSLRVREKVKGAMKVTDKNNLLPKEEYQLCMVPVSGDVRAMENPSLASLHTLFMREHNRICKELWNLNSVDWTKFGGPECDNDRCDEWIYQNARRILIAEWQNIIYSEWLPSILGESRMNDFNLGLDKNRPYNSSADPSILSSFSTAAFRFGHSMINGIFTKKNTSNQAAIRNIPLSDTFFNTEEYQGNGAEQLLAGLWDKKAQTRDRFVTTELTNLLFKDGANFGQDLIARNIARGRDHGLPSFAKFYSKVGPESDPNRDLKCWDNIPQAFDARTWQLLKKVYNRPQDIDLFIGGMAEKNTVGGGVLGNTFGWIVAEQFRLLKDGDRFFFTQEEHDHSFTTKAIDAIKRRKLSDILCDNTKLRTVGADAFLSTSEQIECSASRNALNLADINLLLPSDVAGAFIGNPSCEGGEHPDVKDCCSEINPCGEGQGDCDGPNECLGNLVCGSDNCDSSKYPSGNTDCCEKNCNDKANQCVEWAGLGDCTHPDFKVFMKDNCVGACGYCEDAATGKTCNYDELLNNGETGVDCGAKAASGCPDCPPPSS